jgi:hypothetical protein
MDAIDLPKKKYVNVLLLRHVTSQLFIQRLIPFNRKTLLYFVFIIMIVPDDQSRSMTSNMSAVEQSIKKGFHLQTLWCLSQFRVQRYKF